MFDTVRFQKRPEWLRALSTSGGVGSRWVDLQASASDILKQFILFVFQSIPFCRVYSVDLSKKCHNRAKAN